MILILMQMSDSAVKMTSIGRQWLRRIKKRKEDAATDFSTRPSSVVWFLSIS